MIGSRTRLIRHSLGFILVLTGLIGLITVSAAGCAELEDAGCTSDADCRFGRTCVDSICSGDPDTTSTSPNGATNNGSANNGTTNNGTVNNGAVNNGSTNNGATNNDSTNNNIGEVCSSDGDCPVGSSCEADVCTQRCDQSADCPDNRVCSGSDGCVPPRMCDVIETGSEGICVAAWLCPQEGEVIIICEPDSGSATCECLDAATGETQSFDVENLDCTTDVLARLGNQNCGLRLPEE